MAVKVKIRELYAFWAIFAALFLTLAKCEKTLVKIGNGSPKPSGTCENVLSNIEVVS